jgi:hypothetical protein
MVKVENEIGARLANDCAGFKARSRRWFGEWVRVLRFVASAIL